MARKTIIVDDLTDAEIDAGEEQSIKLVLTVGKPDDNVVTTAEWEVSKFTVGCLESLLTGDLADFIVQMRPLVKVTVSTETIREWVKKTHPEITVNDRGRLPAEIPALYRREVIQKLNPVPSQVTLKSGTEGNGGRA